jgi:hypothetical protein
MNPIEFDSDKLVIEAELTLIYLRDPAAETIEKVISSFNKHAEPLLKYVVAYPLVI